MEELKEAIRKIKNGKVTGHDGIAGEMIKYLDDEGMQELLEIMNNKLINKNNKTPKDWRIGIIMPIYKRRPQGL